MRLCVLGPLSWYHSHALGSPEARSQVTSCTQPLCLAEPGLGELRDWEKVEVGQL